MMEGIPFPFRRSAAPARFMEMASALCGDERPSALIIADPEKAAALESHAAAAGGRSLGDVGVSDAMARLDRIVDVDLVALDCRTPHPVLPALLARLDAMAGMNDIALVVIAGMDMVDMAHMLLRSSGSQLLCEPSDADLASAILVGLRARNSQPELHDIGREGDMERLSDEVARLARALDALTAAGRPADAPRPDRGEAPPWLADRKGGYVGEPAAASFSDSADARLHAGHVRELLRARRLRDQFLPGDLFADPAWDMLLDLMAARLAGERVSVSSLCIAATVPPTTALRCIKHLTERGIFEREADPADGRRVFIVLSDAAASAIAQWFAARRRVLREAAG